MRCRAPRSRGAGVVSQFLAAQEAYTSSRSCSTATTASFPSGNIISCGRGRPKSRCTPSPARPPLLLLRDGNLRAARLMVGSTLGHYHLALDDTSLRDHNRSQFSSFRASLGYNLGAPNAKEGYQRGNRPSHRPNTHLEISNVLTH